MRVLCLGIASLALAAAGCSNDPGRPQDYRGLLCASAPLVCPSVPDGCIAAIVEADCRTLLAHAAAVASPGFQRCTSACPWTHPCADAPAAVAVDCNCLADCVEAEPPESQQAQLDWLECTTPPECGL